MQPASLRDIQESIRNEDFVSAIKLCEAAIMKGEGKTFGIYNILGNCAQNLGDQTKALSAFESALTSCDALTPANVQQSQKVWKAIADLYESLSQWDKQNHALIKIYHIVLEKSNIERAQTLSEKILDVHIKSKSFEEAMDFAVRHLRSLADHTKHASHEASIIEKFARLQDLDLNKKPTKHLSVSAVMKEQSKEPVFPDEIIGSLFGCLKEVNDLAVQQNSISIFIRRYCHYLYNQLMSSNKHPSSSHINEVAQRLSKLIVGVPSALVQEDEIIQYFAAITFLSDSFPCTGDIAAAWDFISQLNTPAANMCISFIKLANLYHSEYPSSMKALALKCLPMVLEKVDQKSKASTMTISTERSPGSTNTTFEELSSHPINIIFTFAFSMTVAGLAYYDFSNLNNEDMFHLVQESRHRMLLLTKHIGWRGQMAYALYLVKALAMAKVSQLSAAKSEILETLRPMIIGDSHAVSAPDILFSQSPESTWNMDIISQQPRAVQWLLVIALRSAQLFAHAKYISLKLQAVVTSIETTASYSWFQSEAVYCDFLADLHTKAVAVKTSNDSIPPITSTVMKHIVISEPVAASYVKQLQLAVKSGVALLGPEFEALVRWRMGVVMWHSGGRLRSDKNGCIAALLASAKLDPNNGAVYTYIGHYYSIELRDIDRAIKCYMKALLGDYLNQEAGISLCELYIGAGDVQKAIVLLNDVQSYTKYAHWSFAMKGQICLFREENELALESFQLALELQGSETDASCWFGLGTAYANLNQNVAAFKSFSMAFTCYPRDLNLVSSLAEVERKLCLLRDAKARYTHALSLQSDDVIALKGFASVCLALSYDHLAIGWTRGIAMEIFEGISAIDALISLHQESTKLSHSFQLNPTSNSKLWQCIYKLKGDLCMQSLNLAQVDFKYAGESVLQPVANLESSNRLLDSTEHSPLNILHFLKQAEECYQQVERFNSEDNNLVISPTNLANIYYDIGLAKYQRAQSILRSRGQGSGLISTSDLCKAVDVSELLSEARELFVTGIAKDASHSGCWNGLGLCLEGNPDAMAQRKCCFVRAIQIDNNAGAFANLGMDLLRSNDEEFALECFSALQLVEANPIVWVNLGNIFEMRPVSSDAHNKAHDAYTAACEIAKPVEALLGSAVAWLKLHGCFDASKNSLSSLVKNIGDKSWESIEANSFDLIELHHEVEFKLMAYLNRKPLHPFAWMLFSWVRCVKGDISTAVESLWRALDCLEIIAESVNRLSLSTDRLVVYSSKLEKTALEALSSLQKCCTRAQSINPGISSTVDEVSLSKRLSSLLLICPWLNTSRLQSYLSIDVTSSVQHHATYPQILNDLMNDLIATSAYKNYAVFLKLAQEISSKLFVNAVDDKLTDLPDPFKCIYFFKYLRILYGVLSNLTSFEGRNTLSNSNHFSKSHDLVDGVVQLLVPVASKVLDDSKDDNETGQSSLCVPWFLSSAQLSSYFVAILQLGGPSMNHQVLALSKLLIRIYPKCAFLRCINGEAENDHTVAQESCDAAMDIVNGLVIKTGSDQNGIGLKKPSYVETQNLGTPESIFDLSARLLLRKVEIFVNSPRDNSTELRIVSESQLESPLNDCKHSFNTEVLELQKRLLRGIHQNPSSLALQKKYVELQLLI